MSSRQQRRRKRDEMRPIIGRTELITAAVVVIVAGVSLGLVLLLGGGGDDDDGDAVSNPTNPPAATVTSTPFEPVDADGQTLVQLGMRSVEALPQGQWSALYDSFTSEFRERCSRRDFEAAGETDAANLGAQLELIRFKYLIDVNITGDTAVAVIVGALGESEYTIQTAYERVDGRWMIAPAPGTTGCNGFNRLSG